jgi:hypothetical protein
VNGRLFLNNVSLGIYGDAVRSPAYRDAKVRTLLETAAEVLGPSAEAPALDLTDDPGHDHRHPAIVLVSNNPYAVDRPLARGTCPALDSGQLGIIVLDAPGDRPRVPGRAWSTPRLEVTARHRSTPGLTARGGTGTAAAFRQPPGVAAGPDLPAPPGRLAVSASPPPRPSPAGEATLW